MSCRMTVFHIDLSHNGLVVWFLFLYDALRGAFSNIDTLPSLDSIELE